MVEAMYENTTGRVVVGSGMSNEFQVNIGLRQRSALSKPIAFHLSNGTNQQEDQHNRCSEEDMYSEQNGDASNIGFPRGLYPISRLATGMIDTGPAFMSETRFCSFTDDFPLNRFTARYI